MKIKKPLVSIIIPVYNVEKYIEDCLNSIKEQTYSNFEVILINDGSLDKSIDICKKFVGMDSRFLLFNQRNQGLSAARNQGLNHIKGEWFIFVDSDDFISPYSLELMLNQVKDNTDMVIADYKNVQEKEIYKFSDWNNPLNIKSIKYSGEEAFSLFCSIKIRSITVWNKLLRTSKYKDILFPLNIYYEDVPTSYKYFLYATEVVKVPIQLYAYRKRRDSIINSNINLKKRSDILKVIEILKEDVRNFDSKKNKSMLTAFAFHNLASWYRNNVTFWEKDNKDIKLILKELNNDALNNRIDISIYRLCPSLFYFNIKVWYKMKHIFKIIINKK